MILDLNKVKLNESIEDGALSVVEQIPGLVAWGDQTHKLRLGITCSITLFGLFTANNLG